MEPVSALFVSRGLIPWYHQNVDISCNEEIHLQACLWAIREIWCKYPVEIIGVDNDSTDRTTEIYEKSGIEKKIMRMRASSLLLSVRLIIDC